MGTVKFFRHSTKLFKYYIPTEFVALAVIEFAVLIFSLYLAFVIRFWNADWQLDYEEFLPKAVVFAVILQLCLVAFGVYQRQAGRFFNLLMLRIASGLLLGLIPLGVSYYFVPGFFLGRGTLLIAVIISFALILMIRLFFRKVVTEQSMWTRVLVLGAGKRARSIRNARSTGEIRGLNIVAYVAMPGDEVDSNASGNTITLD